MLSLEVPGTGDYVPGSDDLKHHGKTLDGCETVDLPCHAPFYGDVMEGVTQCVPSSNAMVLDVASLLSLLFLDILKRPSGVIFITLFGYRVYRGQQL